MAKKLYLMRHGQTLFNLTKKIQGWSDSPLTEIGKEQARIAGKYLRDNKIKIDHAYSSTQERASDTLELVVDIPYERLKGIKEWNFGVFEGESELLNPKHPNTPTYATFFADHGFGGETNEEVLKRMNETLTEIMEKEDHQNVLAVSHGGAIWNFYLHWNPDLQGASGFTNCSFLIFEYEDKKFKFIEKVDHDYSHLV